MTAAEAIVTRLKATAAVTALVSQRIYTSQFPQSIFTTSTPRCIRVQRISESQPVHLRGGVTQFRTRIQIDSAALKYGGYDWYAGARAVDEAVRGPGDGTGLIGYSGTVGSMAIEAIIPDDVREFFDADEVNVFRIVRDVIVLHKG